MPYAAHLVLVEHALQGGCAVHGASAPFGAAHAIRAPERRQSRPEGKERIAAGAVEGVPPPAATFARETHGDRVDPNNGDELSPRGLKQP